MQHQNGHNASALHSAPAASHAADDAPEIDQRLISGSSTKTKSQQRPVRPLTVPKEFNLSTSKRSARPDAAKQEWKSLAQLVREFQTKTPPRFRRVPRNTQPVTSHFSPHTTEPKSPTLHTALRHEQSTPSSSDATQAAGGSSFVAVAERAMLFSATLRKAHNPYHSSSLWSVGTHSAVFSSNRGSGHHHLSPLAHSIDASDLTHQGRPFGLHSVPVDAFNKLQITIPEDTQQLLDPPALSSSPSFTRSKPSRPPPLSLRHSLPSFSPYPVPPSPAATASPKPTTPLRRSTQATPPLARSAPAKPTNAFPRTPTSRGARPAHLPTAHTASPLTRSAPAHPYTPPTRPASSRTTHPPTPSSTPALRRWSSSTKTTLTPSPSPSAPSKLNRSTPSPLAAARPRTPLSHTKQSIAQSPHTATATTITPKSAQRSRPQKPAGPPSRLSTVSPRPSHLSPIATSTTKPARAQAPPTTPKPTTRAPMTPPFSTHRAAILTARQPTPEPSPAHGECPQPSTPDKPLPDSLHPHPWSASASTVGDPSDPSDGLTDPSALLDIASVRTAAQSPSAVPPADDSPILSAIRHADAVFTWDHALGFDEDEEDHPRHPTPPTAAPAAPPLDPAVANGVAVSLTVGDVADDSTLLDAAAAGPFADEAPAAAAEVMMAADSWDEVGSKGAQGGGGTFSPVTAHPVEADELDVWTVRDQGEAAAVVGEAPADGGKSSRRRRLWVLDQEPDDDGGEGGAFD